MKTMQLISLLGLAPMLACATAGAGPHEMSAEQHEVAARREEQAAAARAGQYDPRASVVRRQCGPGSGAVLHNDSGPCWTSVANPTERHLRAAEAHLRAAAEHRAGSAALRQAEARACVGISPEDRDVSPLEHVEDIVSVAALKEIVWANRQQSEQLIGAAVVFRTVPGMTTEWLQRLVDCHLARSAALGHVVPEMPNCPLVLEGVEARVTSTRRGFVIAIRSANPATAREILARARRLAGADLVSSFSPAGDRQGNAVP